MKAGFDWSIYQPRMTPILADVLLSAGFERACIATDLATDIQVAAQAGLLIDCYRYLYFSLDPVEQARSCLATFDAVKPAIVRRLWLDCEDPYASRLSAADTVRFIARAVESLGGFDIGIYTAPWWWVPETSDSDAFSDLPLWLAQYDHIAALPADVGFGGWQKASAKQYHSGYVGLLDADLDLDVFDE